MCGYVQKNFRKVKMIFNIKKLGYYIIYILNYTTNKKTKYGTEKKS